MYESRCGICCNQCERKAEIYCKGCLNMEKTFWGGTCEVKACCEKKQRSIADNAISFPVQCLLQWEWKWGMIHLPG